MQRRTILAVGLAAIMLMPVTAAYAPTGNSAPAQGEPASSQATPTESGDGNFTRLYIEDGYNSEELKPGETTTFNITVGNGEDRAVELNPRVVLPQVEGRPLQADWVTIEDADTTLEADEERTFTVTVSVPDDAELGQYRSLIAFTNQTVTYRRGQPERPVHAATIGVEVFEEPTVEVVQRRYYSPQIESGDSYTYEVEVRNTGEEAVPLNPTLETEEARRSPRQRNTVERSWFEIDAPNEVAPGENATVAVTVTPPESADVGRYDAEVDLGLEDPARPDRGDYWQRVDLHFRVWEQPEEPFETAVQVSEETETLTLRLSANQYEPVADDAPADFDVTLVAPNGSTVEPERVQVTDSGNVDLGERRRPDARTQGPYASDGGNTEFVYRVESPESGEWTARILPENTTNFDYEIVREES
jgi:hypothetical protein